MSIAQPLSCISAHDVIAQKLVAALRHTQRSKKNGSAHCCVLPFSPQIMEPRTLSSSSETTAAKLGSTLSPNCSDSIFRALREVALEIGRVQNKQNGVRALQIRPRIHEHPCPSARHKPISISLHSVRVGSSQKPPPTRLHHQLLKPAIARFDRRLTG
jgi:hypothetical protein